ncbi:hypothetical protein IQ07DRAFT_524504 [Pyrenochaeta sp. DS3sAY3a]|nr:hypothetical protein IQ07DRAFT_524504 [Pyrenochaeta sp. DS3sAY3a]
MSGYPEFSDLPLRKGDAPMSAWGLWGIDDELGTLNHLTPEVVQNAVSEASAGLRFSLNWSLELPTTPGFGRGVHQFHHQIHQAPNALVLDDSLHDFNTQKSSQWDGQRHFAYQKEKLFYNGTTLEEILSANSGALGIQNWSKVGGIAGRGVLLDYQSWAEENARNTDMSTSTPILFDDLMACYKAQQNKSTKPLELRKGDILLVRSGFTKSYNSMSRAAEEAMGQASPTRAAGVHQDKRLLEWLWSNQVAAVGGDAQAWECLPSDPSSGFLFHEVLIAGWGCPIAELLWLEDLAEVCKRMGRWTFLLTSSPLNVFGGVASPANMMAIM